jgi:diaminopimelate epimerase
VKTSLDLVYLSATGNRFAVADAIGGAAPADPVALARSIGQQGDVDGLLLLLPPKAGGDCGMVLYNTDGSRPEACGNGLRCIARLAVANGHVSGDGLVVETDAGPRRLQILRRAGEVVAVRAEMGVPVIESERTTLEVSGGSVEVGLVSMGNPHCVLFVDDIDSAPLETLGAELERHPRFPERTNVEFVQQDGARLRVRIFERGVGETDSCGTGVSAAAVIAIRRGLMRSPVAIETRGGRLRITWDGAGTLELEGP